MSEKALIPPDPSSQPEIQTVDTWQVDATDAINRMVVQDSYLPNIANPHEDNPPGMQEDAIIYMRANAQLNPEYFHAVAVAAEDAASQSRGNNFAVPKPSPVREPGTAGLNENLREALEIRTPYPLEKAFDTTSPELTASEISDFNQLIVSITELGHQRFNWRMADKKAVQMGGKAAGLVTDQEKHNWEGADGRSGMRNLLATKLAQALDANPRYRALLREQAVKLNVMSDGSASELPAAQALAQTRKSMAEKARADHLNPANQATAARLASKGSDRLDLPVDPKRHQNRWNRLPTDIADRFTDSGLPGLVKLPVKIAGVGMRAVSEIQPTQRRRRQRRDDMANFTIGNGREGVRDPHGKPDGYAKTLPAEGSADWHRNLAVNRAYNELRAADAQKDLEQILSLDEETKMRQTSFLEVVEAANKKLAGEVFMDIHGRPEEFEAQITDALSAAFGNFFSNDMLSTADDHALFAQLSAMTEYIDTIDAEIRDTDPLKQRCSMQQLVALRANMVGLANRSRYRREQLRIGTAGNLDGDIEDGYFGQYGSVYRADKGIELQPNGVILYDDGSYYDPTMSPEGIRNPDGVVVSHPTKNELTPLAPFDHSGESLQDLEQNFQTSLSGWFETQSLSDANAYAALEYAQAVIDACEAFIEDDTDSDEAIDAAYVSLNKAHYWKAYISQLSGIDTIHDDVGVMADGSIEHKNHTLYGSNGRWHTLPSGVAERYENGIVVERYAPNGDELLAA